MSARAQEVNAEQDDTRTKLLKAALEVFSENGYDGATVREICRRADVNLALVNYHFGDKLELYLAVIRFAIDAEAKIELFNQAVAQNADPCDALRQVIIGCIERLSATHNRFGFQMRFMLKEMAQPTPALASILDATLRPLYDRMRGLIGRILELPPDHEKTRLCAHSVIGQLAHYSHAQPVIRQLWPEMTMSPEQRKMIANHISDFSLAYLQAARAESTTKTPSKSPRKSK